MTDPRGSIWRKWDLHFHSPSSYDYKDSSVTDDDIVQALKANAISAVAITDHHTLDVQRLLNLQQLASPDITVFPGIELRSELGGSESVHFIGIFRNGLSEQQLRDLWTSLQGKLGLTKTEIEKVGNDRIYTDFKEAARVIHELGGIISVHAGTKTNSIESIKNRPLFKQQIKEDLLTDSIDVLEVGDQQQTGDYREIVFPDIGFQVPIIVCSDNHDAKDYVTRSPLWIKSDTTFDGLKQIIYEPSYRVHLGPSPPYEPIYQIRSIELDFPDYTSLGVDPFCFRGRHSINLSANLTTFIGGRGTGKSMILNLLYERLEKHQNRFFQENELLGASVDECVSVVGGEGVPYVEFLSQNEIEEFALDEVKLTQAIETRIKKQDQEGLLDATAAALATDLTKIDRHRMRINEKKQLKRQIQETSKLAAAAKRVVDFLKDSDYKALSESIQRDSGELEIIRSSSRQLARLIAQLQNTLKDFPTTTESSNQYAVLYNTILATLTGLVQDYMTGRGFQETKKQEAELSRVLGEKKTEMQQLLKAKNLSEENLIDIAKANESLIEFSSQLSESEKKLDSLEKEIEQFTIDSDSKDRYETILKEKLNSISERLKSLGEHVEPITLRYEFNAEAALLAVVGELQDVLPTDEKGAQQREDYLLAVLSSVQGLWDIDDRDALLDLIATNTTHKKTASSLGAYLADPDNFELFFFMLLRHRMDSLQYKRISATYAGKALSGVSFGQRCTAAIVLLLSLGNTPLMIDEPEAHLDSLLIARYLVDLVKETKQVRQIIFATHNANFVINGDCELVNILTMDEARKTEVTPTTIENFDHREDLLALEGGREAFALREEKYEF